MDKIFFCVCVKELTCMQASSQESSTLTSKSQTGIYTDKCSFAFLKHVMILWPPKSFGNWSGKSTHGRKLETGDDAKVCKSSYMEENTYATLVSAFFDGR